MLKIFLLAWIGLFAYFCLQIENDKQPAQPADAIVVLTGDEGRITEGLRLLSAGLAPRLLISGLSLDTKIPQDSRITPGYKALNTIGNAQEIAEWVDQYQLKRIIVVTHDYHMPRVKGLIGNRLNIDVFYDSVASKLSPELFTTLFIEYHKWIKDYVYDRLGYDKMSRQDKTQTDRRVGNH